MLDFLPEIYVLSQTLVKLGGKLFFSKTSTYLLLHLRISVSKFIMGKCKY